LFEKGGQTSDIATRIDLVGPWHSKIQVNLPTGYILLLKQGGKMDDRLRDSTMAENGPGDRTA
jgi:hypothetical protein